MIEKKVLKAPIRIAILFSVFTILLFLFGPYSYPDINRPQLIIFLIISNLSMYGGFIAGTNCVLKLRRNSCTYHTIGINTSQEITFCGCNSSQIINFLFWIALIDCIPKFILYTGAYSMDFSTMLTNATKFFTSAQDIYVARQELGSATGAWRYINYFIVLTGPLYWAYTPLALLQWKSLSLWKKIGSYIIWFFFLLQYLLTGTNVGFFDFFLTVLFVALIRNYFNNKKVKTPRKRKSIFLVFIIVLVLFFVFDTVMGSRIGDQYLNGGSLGTYRYTFNDNSIIWKFVPNSIKAMTAYLTRYLSNSYNAIAFAMDVPFKSTFGLGHSWFVLDNLDSGLSTELWARTFNMQIESMFGYGHYANWHTAYLWFANDVSFWGVPILFFFLFFYFGRAWKRFIIEKDMFCFLRFMLFIKLCYFISANNQIFQNSDTLLAFWILLLLTIFGKKCSLEKNI